MKKNKILFVSPFQPYGINDQFGHKDVQGEFFLAHITRNQGMFQIRSVNPFVNLHFLSINIKTPSVVLEYPTVEMYINELKKGCYTHVAITTVLATNPKAKHMIELSAQYAPSAEVIIGGYGVAMENPEAYFGVDLEHICRGDGVTFMRKLLGEEDAPVLNPLIESRPSHVLGFKMDTTLYIVGSMGCENKCEYCITSHFYDCKNEKVLKSGKELYDLIMTHRAANYETLKKNGVQTVYIFNENFLGDKKLVEEFGALIEGVDDFPVSIGCFGSAAAVMQYDHAYLAKIGISNIWIGVESLKFKHKKLRDINMNEMFQSLYENGISTIASLIIGFPFHTPENIQDDINYFFSLKATFYQFTIYSPTPGTPSFELAKKNNWIGADYDLRAINGFNEYFKHPNFESGGLEEVLNSCVQREMAEKGPTIFRYLEIAARKLEIADQSTLNSTASSYQKKYYKRILDRALLMSPLGLLIMPTRFKKNAYVLSVIYKMLKARKISGLLALLLSPLGMLYVLVYNLFYDKTEQPEAIAFVYENYKQIPEEKYTESTNPTGLFARISESIKNIFTTKPEASLSPEPSVNKQ
ncbi:MAG: hypothetical protein H7844_01205 [Nitrospirae bacterium YQR-1]